MTLETREQEKNQRNKELVHGPTNGTDTPLRTRVGTDRCRQQGRGTSADPAGFQRTARKRDGRAPRAHTRRLACRSQSHANCRSSPGRKQAAKRIYGDLGNGTHNRKAPEKEISKPRWFCRKILSNV